MLLFMLCALLFAWLIFTFALVWINVGTKTSDNLAKTLWNARIQKLSVPPFSVFMHVYEQKSYIKSFIMVLLINGVMNVFMYILGITKIGLLMIPVQAFVMGSLIGQGDAITKVYGVVTAAFELSAFTIACLLGFFGAYQYWWVPAILLVLNALTEAFGVLIGSQGVPGIDAVKNKEYK